MHTVHDFLQGSAEWHAYRAKSRNASDAAAVLGQSRYCTRSELLRWRATGIAPEVDDATQRRFDEGHRAEAAARVLVESILDEDLYPIIASREVDGIVLSASLDGVTITDEVIWENKNWNEKLAATVRAGVLPDSHWPQCEQQLLVVPADYVLFTCTDGTPERFASLEYRAVPGRAEQLIAGWRQFEADLADYVPTEPALRVVAAPVEMLPAVSVRLDGQLSVASNLPEFAAALRGFIGRIPAEPQNDQEYADCEAGCKALRRAEGALDDAEDEALAQLSGVEALRRTIGELRDLARDERLSRDPLVCARKEQIRLEIVLDAHARLDRHIAELNRALGEPLMPPIATDFRGAVKNKRSLDGLRDAVDRELTQAKLAANEIARRITANLPALRKHEMRFGLPAAERARLALADPAQLPALLARLDAADAQGAPMLTLGVINERLAPLHLSVAGLRALGFEPDATSKSARLYREADFGHICETLIAHVRAVSSGAFQPPQQEGVTA